MLGRPYLIAAERVRGLHIAGERLGCPTLNFKMPETGKVLPPPGVYAAELETCSRGADKYGINMDTGGINPTGINAGNISISSVEADGANNKRLYGALYFGDCPTYEGREAHFEFHALDFGDGAAEPAVGESVNLWLREYIRPGVAFQSEDALKAQIATDVDKIKNIFANINQY
jgi:riboflavin kinase/FMN adenylyltransferase